MGGFKNGVTLAMTHLVRTCVRCVRRSAHGGICGGGEAQQFSCVDVLQQVMFKPGVLYRVVAPLRDLMHAAVGCPGVAATGLGHLKAK